jgi:L-aspartate oxidase
MNKSFDIIVIGTGIAGLMYALKTAKLGKIAMITKKGGTDTSTNYAQGGIASVLSGTDNFANHIHDTLVAGCGICNRRVVEKVVRLGPKYIKELADAGVAFTKRGGQYELGREGGHSHNRVVHSADHTGRNIEKALIESVRNHRNIEIFEEHTAIDLITEYHFTGVTPRSGPTCFGVYVYDNKRMKVDAFAARLVVMATGGAGQTYRHTTNPAIATGDGVAMAYRSGAAIGNLEFVQFHPTCLYTPGYEPFLISEAVRGEGGKLINRNGYRFMENSHPMAELAPRDIVARAIDMELKDTGAKCVYIDITHRGKTFIERRFPTIVKTCRARGIDPVKQPIPVVPAAHYFCGGVITDIHGCTSIKRLLAAGEVACTGMHGANRLASNSLLEAVAFADFCSAWTIANWPKLKAKKIAQPPAWDESGVFDHREWVLVSHDLEEIRQLMWDYVGIVRSNNRLKIALDRCAIMREQIKSFYKKNPVRLEVLELRNIAEVAYILIQSALSRKESRGLHCNLDYPGIDDKHFKKNTIIQRKFSIDGR